MKSALTRASESIAEAMNILSAARTALSNEAAAMPDGPDRDALRRIEDAIWASEKSLSGLGPWLERMIGEATE